jgi:trimethylamine--corrinoid protein Co-methyltransferase
MIQTHGTSMTSAFYARMGRQECEQIHLASLEILERTGVDVHDEKARAILVDGGAQTDGLRVRLPAYMVERALATAPKRITLYNRNGQVAMRAGGYNTYYGGGSDCLNVLDHHTGERRRAVLKDVKDAATLFDALPGSIRHVGFLPEDMIHASTTVTRWMMLNHTTKPIAS